MTALRRLGLLWGALAAASAWGQAPVTSPGPEQVDVTVYRDPGRNPDEPFDMSWLNGFALISETRRVAIPAGESEVRFEGVAAGIVPQSAIVTGFPEGIVERNRDAYLLSPATLLDRSLGRRVMIRRTVLATGETREEEAVIRSGADGAVVLQTRDGFEALRCTGLPETLIYESVPAELSPTPTLSVRVRASQPVTATVTLAYLASGFDWQANYVAMLAPDGEHIDLFAWLTLASNDDTGFAEADAQAVAGRVNREAVPVQPPEGGPLQLRCWPQGTTSSGPPPPPPPSPPALRFGEQTIVVTGSRIPAPNLAANTPVTVMTAEQEDLGDLKLYRIPEPVTIAANSQKQVALLQRSRVPVRFVYRQRLLPGVVEGPSAAQRIMLMRNRERDGLGLPLPGGGLVLFAAGPDRSVLVGEGSLDDKAIGEEVEVELGDASGVHFQTRLIAEGKSWREYELVVTNDRASPVRFEAEFDAQQLRRRGGRRLQRREGRPLWVAEVPANGRVALRYRLPRDPD